MECPEVRKFSTNEKQSCWVTTGRVGDSDLKQRVKSSLGRLGGITGVTVVLPCEGRGVMPGSNTVRELRSMLEEDTEYYSVQDFDPSVLFDKEFLVNFVDSGELVILTDRSGSYVEEEINFHNHQLSLSLIEGKHNLSALEEHCRSKAKTKDGLKHFSRKMTELDMKASQLRAVRESLQGTRLRVRLSWSHPDPSTCPSSVAAFLCQVGARHVEERKCEVSSHVLDPVMLPVLPPHAGDGWDQDQAEQVLHWVGGAALNLRLQPSTEAVSEGSVSCLRVSGLLSGRTVTHLATSASSLLQQDKQLAWLAIAVHGPRARLEVSGSSLVEVRNSALALVITRNGKWIIRESCSKDFSNCKKSKYN